MSHIGLTVKGRGNYPNIKDIIVISRPLWVLNLLSPFIHACTVLPNRILLFMIYSELSKYTSR